MFDIRSSRFKWSKDSDGAWLMILANEDQIKAFLNGVVDKAYSITIKRYFPSRSLKANGYFWTLVNQMSKVVGSTEDECHIEMLKRYGQSSIVSAKNQAVDMFISSIRYYEIIKESELNGEMFTHIRVFKGSSDMDTKEMAILIDGVVGECQELGIPTMTPAEIERLKSAWGKSKGESNE